MSDCSFTATRNAHAKHNQSVRRIPRGAERRQAKDYYAKDYKRPCFGSEIKGRNSWNLTTCTNTHDGFKVRNASRICQKIIKPLSMRWAPANKSCTTKPQNEKWEEAIFLQILELTSCSHVGLFVHSHPKVTCQTQEISGSHTSRRWARANKTLEFLSSTSGNKKRKSVCWRGTYGLFRWK